MPADMTALAADLAAETAVTRGLVAALEDAGWHTPTPAAGWDNADQISHHACFDGVTVRSAVRPEEFEAGLAEAHAGGISPDTIAARFRDRTGAQLLAWFDTARAELLETFAGLDPRASGRVDGDRPGLRGRARPRPGPGNAARLAPGR